MTRALLLLMLALAPEAAQAQTDAGVPLTSGKFSVAPFALPAYQPETSFLLGGAASLVYEPPEGSGLKQSQLLLAGVATLKKQFSLLLSPDWYLLDDRLHLGGTLSVARYPDQFFGLGAQTRAEDGEPYTPVLWEAEVSPKWRVARNVYLGPSVRFQHVSMVELQEDGRLARGDVNGSAGGRTVQLGVAAVWDTRDSTLYPTRGTWVRANFRSALPEVGSDYRFDLLRVDARAYWTLPWANHLLALQALGELRWGEPPFYDTGKLGGDNARGYFEGRFRERQHFSVQAEYRAHLFWRIGGVVFGSVSTVARDLEALQVSALKPAGGVGVRFQPLKDLPINIRLDVAYGNDLAFYLNLGEAF